MDRGREWLEMAMSIARGASGGVSFVQDRALARFIVDTADEVIRLRDERDEEDMELELAEDEGEGIIKE